MIGSLANPWMLLGLLGMAIPIVIHLLSRRKVETIDWGAMQFLEIGRRHQRRLELSDLLLMAARMVLLGLVALALARPFLGPTSAPVEVSDPDGAVPAGGRSSEPRDVVLVIDGSDSMARRDGGSSPHDRAVAWARDLLGRLAPGSTVGLVLARERVVLPIDPPTIDRARVDQALATLPPPRGSSDLPAAIAQGLRILDGTENARRDLVVLTDGQAFPWRLDEPARWKLLRDLHAEQSRRSGAVSRLWVARFHAGNPPDSTADGAVGPIDLSRGLVPPMMPLQIRATIVNAGPGTMTRTAELVLDGVSVAGSAQVVGPIPPGASVPVEFRAAIETPGSHPLSVRLIPDVDDPLAANDESIRVVEVVEALPVLLVDGEPGLEPLSGEVAYLRAALAPTGDDTPQVVTTVAPIEQFEANRLAGQKVLVLANVDRLNAAQDAAVSAFLGAGGGVLVAPGDRLDADAWNATIHRDGAGWLPASIGDWRGDGTSRQVMARPVPSSFTGSSLAPFARGESPALETAGLFAYRILTPAVRPPTATVLARLDTGDPWIVERPFRAGRAIVTAGPLDAEGGTLPVNADFVPFVHEIVFRLADSAAATRMTRSGEPIVIDLGGDLSNNVASVTVTLPTGERLDAPVERAGLQATARLDAAPMPGLYRFERPGSENGPAYLVVEADSREWDSTPLDSASAETLAESWPLVFADHPETLPDLLLASGEADVGRRPIWRGLILAALAGLCLEVYLTRRMVRERGLADGPGDA